ncbi:MAG: hypothetical protein V7645_2929 [Actinomycetota bacterium]|jgi:hypothetical protein
MIRRHGSPVADTPQCLEEGVEDRPGRATGELGDETDATRIALAESWIKRVETRQLHTFAVEEGRPRPVDLS